MDYSRGPLFDGMGRQAPLEHPYGPQYDLTFIMTPWTEGYTWQDVINEENENGKTLHGYRRFLFR